MTKPPDVAKPEGVKQQKEDDQQLPEAPVNPLNLRLRRKIDPERSHEQLSRLKNRESHSRCHDTEEND